MTFEGLSAEGMFWMKVGSREQQCLRSCYLHCFLEYPLTIFSPPVNDEHGVCADDDPNIGYQVNVLVRNHNDPRSNFPGQCWLNRGRTVELRHHCQRPRTFGTGSLCVTRKIKRYATPVLWGGRSEPEPIIHRR